MKKDAFLDFQIGNQSLQWLAIVWGMHQAMPGIIFAGCVSLQGMCRTNLEISCFASEPPAGGVHQRLSGRLTAWVRVQVPSSVQNGAAAAQDMGAAGCVHHLCGHPCHRGPLGLCVCHRV